MNTREEFEKYLSECNLRSKKILVTGGAGFIGSNLIAKLLENP